MAAGQRIFNTEGYFATDSNAIARDAGYAPATFYIYFDDKLALFLTVYERWVQEEWAQIGSFQPTTQRRALLTRVIEAVISRHVKTAVFRRSLRALDLMEPDVRARRRRHRSEQLTWMLDLGKAMGGGDISIESRTLALLTVERMADAIAERELNENDVDLARLRSRLIKTVEATLFETGNATREKVTDKIRKRARMHSKRGLKTTLVRKP